MIAIDVYFLLNFIFDLLLMQMVVRMRKCRRQWTRLFASAAAGAGISCILLLYQKPEAVCIVGTYLFCPFLMCRIACRPKGKRETAACLLSFYLTACVTGGGMDLLYGIPEVKQWKSLGLIGLMVAVQAVLIVSERVLAQNHVDKTLFLKTQICFRKRTAEMTGIWDTGNRLCSLAKKPVHLIDVSGAEELLEKEELECLLKLEKQIEDGKIEDCFIGTIPLYPVPYCGVGSGNSWLLAIEMDEMTVWKKGQTVCVHRPLIGISKTMFHKEKKHRIILNPFEL